jgi:acetolactate synthase-1/3 small subunit
MKPRAVKQVTLVADADDTLITINRVISLLRARRFAIVSVAAARTHTPGVARLTIVIDAGRTPSGRVTASLAKLADVWNVAELDPAETLCRELALVRVAAVSGALALPPAVASRDDVRVVHRDDRCFILEIVAEPEDVDGVIQALEPSQVVELVRARQLAIARNLPSPSAP